MRLTLNLKTIPLGIAIVTISFFVSLKTMDWLWPRGAVVAPVLVELPPLPPAPRSSSILAPVAIALSAIRGIFGPDSAEYDQAGGTRTSDRKAPTRKSKAVAKAA